MLFDLQEYIEQWLFTAKDAASIAYFRIVFGVLMLWEIERYLANGWIDRFYTGKNLYFTYFGFSWVHPLTPQMMHALFWILGVCAFLIMIGALYRIAAAIFWLGFSYAFLIDASYYINHIYLICLLAFLLIFIPAHRIWSVDAFIGKKLSVSLLGGSKVLQWFFPSPSHPLPAPLVLSWGQFLLAFQVGCAYFFGGIAKLTSLDWLQGFPMRIWLQGDASLPFVGSMMKQPWVAIFMSYSGLLLDLFVIPILLWRRTRWLGVLLILSFNLMNSQLFQIGVFPWLMIASIPLFFESDWIRKVWDRLTYKREDAAQAAALREEQRSTAQSAIYIPPMMKIVLATYLVFQALFPLRHFLYMTNTLWSEESEYFSWHMKISDKGGNISFRVVNKSTRVSVRVDPRSLLDQDQLAPMATHPEMMLQFAHFLAQKYGQGHPETMSVFVDSFASLDGREMQRFIDPQTDLAHTELGLGHASWILPLTTPLRSVTPGSAEYDFQEKID